MRFEHVAQIAVSTLLFRKLTVFLPLFLVVQDPPRRRDGIASVRSHAVFQLSSIEAERRQAIHEVSFGRILQE